MKQFCLLCLLITSLFLSACAVKSGNEQPSLTETNQPSSTEFVGYVTKIENQRALVVNPVSRKINETRKEFYDAVWVSNMPSNIEIGQNVHVWFEGDSMPASYPGQGKAAKVTISDIQKPEKAILSQDEVIRKALMNKDIAKINILVIKELDFDAKSAMWTIRFKSATITDSPLEEQSIKVPDKRTLS